MVRGKHNVLVHYVDVFAPDPSGVVLCKPFKWDILWFISGQKFCFLCVQQQQNEFHSATTRTCGCLCTWTIWSYPMQPFYLRYFVVHHFWSKIVWSKIHIFHYLNIPPSKLEHRIDSLSSLGYITCEWVASSSQPTIILDVIAVYPCFQNYSYKNQSRTVLNIVTVGWRMLPHKFWQGFPHKYS